MFEDSNGLQRHELPLAGYAPRMIGTIHLRLLLARFAAWANRQLVSVIAYRVEETRALLTVVGRVPAQREGGLGRASGSVGC